MPLSRYKIDTLEWIQAGTPDQWGEPGTPTTTAILGRIDRSQALVRDYNGEEVTAAGRVLMSEGPPTPGKDKLKWDGEEYVVISYEELRNHSRRAYWVYFR